MMANVAIQKKFTHIWNEWLDMLCLYLLEFKKWNGAGVGSLFLREI